MKPSLLIALCATMLGCHFGQRIEDFDVAHQPGGATAEVRQASGTIISGELLAVSDSNIIMLWSGAVTGVPYARTRSMSFEILHIRLEHGERPSPDQLERLRLVSRFPQGVTPELRPRLLATYHQNAIMSVNQ